MIFAEYLVARDATRAHWRIRRRRRTWALRVMRADATAVGSPTTFCFELCGRSDTSRALPQSSDAPPRPSANVRASVPARARGSVRRRPRNHGPITHLPRRQAETAPPLNATYSSFDSHDSWPRAGHVGALLATTGAACSTRWPKVGHATTKRARIHAGRSASSMAGCRLTGGSACRFSVPEGSARYNEAGTSTLPSQMLVVT